MRGHRRYYKHAAAEAMRAAAQAMERLTRLKEKTEAASYAEVIRNALRLYEALVDEHEKGAEFSLTRSNGETVAYKIFV